jgi:hypothetical protein
MTDADAYNSSDSKKWQPFFARLLAESAGLYSFFCFYQASGASLGLLCHLSF